MNRQLPEIKGENVELVFDPIVTVTQKRYEELIEAENILNILCRVISEDKPYNMPLYSAIAGKERLPICGDKK